MPDDSTIEASPAPIQSAERANLEDERPLNRQQVVDALKFGVNKLTTALNNPTRSMPNELRREQRWVQASIIDAENRANLDNSDSQGTFENKFPSETPGESVTLKEGIPVERLIKFLEEEAATENDEEEKQKLKDSIRTLKKSSKSFTEIHGEDPALLQARIRQEANLISDRDDPRKTGSMDEDWYLAEKTISERRELVLPEETVEPTAASPAPATGTTTEPSTTTEPRTTTEPEDPTLKQFEIDIINIQEAIDKLANDQARKRVAEFLREGRWFNLFRWPSKIGVRLGEGGAVQMVTERIRREMIANNTSFMRANQLGSAINQLNEERTQAQASQQAQVDRFKAGNIERTAREERVAVQGQLKNEIINNILRPIDQGTITTPDQVRAALADFVRTHQNDAQVQALFGSNASDFGGRAEYFATDILEMGLRIKESRILHEASLEQIDAAIKINFGLAREAYNTDTQTITDRLAAATRRRNLRGGSTGVRVANAALGATLLNPVFVAAAASLGVNGVLKAAGWGARAADIPSLLTGVGFGAAITAGRRGVEIGRDNQTHRAERALGEQIEQRQHSNIPFGRFIERLSGGYRREDLEKFRYDAAQATNLINGGGHEMIADQNHPPRRSVTELRGLDLTDPANREAVASRIAEIQTRLTRGQEERRDLLQYTRRELVNQEKNQLYQARDQLQQSLIDSGMNEADTNQLVDRFNDEWNGAVDRDVRDKNQAFLIYRTRQVAGAAAFGGAIGLGSGLTARGVVEGVKWVDNNTDLNERVGSAVGGAFSRLGSTVRETTNRVGSSPTSTSLAEDQTMVAGSFSEEPTAPVEGQVIPGVNKETFAELFNKPGTMGLGAYKLAVDGDNNRILDGVARNASILDSAGNPIDTPPLKLTSDGELVFGGSTEKLPESLQEFLNQRGGTFEAINGTQFNIEDKVKNLTETGQREIFAYGNSTVSVDGANSTVSILQYPTQTNVYGIINPDGTFTFDPENPANAKVDWDTFKQNMGREAWGISSEPVVTVKEVLPSQPVEKPILDYYEEKGMVERGGDRVWHQNETPIRDLQGNLLERYDRSLTKVLGVDGKEMQNYHNIITTPEGHKQIQVDFSQMRSILIDNMRGVNVVDQTIDPVYGQVADKIVEMPDGTRQYISFDIAVTPNEAANEAGKVISFNASNHPEIKTGHLNLDLSSPETKALFQFDEQGNPIYNQWGNFQKAFFMEVSQTTKDESGNVIGRNILSTTVGPGTDNVTVTPPPPPLPPPHEAVVLDPPPAVKYIPGSGDIVPPTPVENDFFIPPIPMAPRHALPPMKERRIPDSMYGGEPTADRLALFEKHRSPNLRNNPEAPLDPYNEAEAYFNRQNPEYLREIQTLASKIQPPPSPNLKAIVCIPVAGHQEGANIYESLNNYTFQDAAKDQYEILLFVNQPETDREGNPIRPDRTMAEIERFRRDHPDMPIRVVSRVMPFDQAKISYVRKYLNDIALLRHHQRDQGAGDIVLISNDADNKGIAPTYINNFIQKFEENTHTDAMLGQLDWDPEAYTKYPLVHFGTRLFQYLNAIGRHNSGRMVSSGASSAFKGSIYAGIGGYIPEISHGEDISIGQAIIAARGDHTRIQYGGARVSRLYTSARRAVDSLNSGLVPVIQWNNGFSAFDDEVRRLQLGEGQNINYSDPGQVEKLKTDLEVVINKTLDVYEGDERVGKDAPYYRRALRYLGVQYKLRNGNVFITNMDQIGRRLQHYQRIGVLQRDIKSGKGTLQMRNELRMLEDSYRNETSLRQPAPFEDNFVFHQTNLSETSPPSERLRNNPAVVLDVNVETSEYLSRQTPEYTDQLRRLNSQIDEGMNPNTQAIICIPVAGTQESENVYRSIQSYAQQAANLDTFEVLLFVNAPENVNPDQQETIQQTMAEITRAMNDFPALNLSVVTAQVPRAQLRIGNLRKIATDLALLRRQEANIDRDILLLSNDADNEGLSPNYISDYIQYFADNTNHEGAVGNLLYDPKAFVRLPILHARTEFVNRLDRQGFINGNVDLFGSNSSMKSSIYSAIGGYPPGLRGGEQEWTGNTIRALRNTRDTLGYAGDDSLLVTNARRGVATYLEGRAEQISFGDEDAENSMRQLDYTQLPIFNWDNPDMAAQIQNDVSEYLNSIINNYELSDQLGKNSYFYRSNLAKMGIVYHVEGDPNDPNSRIEIDDMTGFIQRERIMSELMAAGETNMAKIYMQVPDANAETGQLEATIPINISLPITPATPKSPAVTPPTTGGSSTKESRFERLRSTAGKGLGILYDPIRESNRALGRAARDIGRGASAVRNRIRSSPRSNIPPATPETTPLPIPDRPFTVPLGGTLNIQSERGLTPDEQTLLSDKYGYIRLRQSEGANIDEILNEVRTNDERFVRESTLAEEPTSEVFDPAIEVAIDSMMTTEGISREEALNRLRALGTTT